MHLRNVRIRRAALGLLLAQGAPLGWLALRALGGHAPGDELRASFGLYLYLCVSTSLVFAVFGFVSGTYEQRLQAISRTDPITGLANARAFTEALATEVARATRARTPLTVLTCDIDRFKEVNDRCGHAAGDQVLHRVGEALRTGRRREDVVARVGGDEFALLFPGMDGTAAVRVAERAAAALGVIAGQLPMPVTLSIGAAELRPGDTPQALLARADQAMYAAKQAGRDRVVAAPS
jgi:diguanylate cyclase (GGDEF)-like protein